MTVSQSVQDIPDLRDGKEKENVYSRIVPKSRDKLFLNYIILPHYDYRMGR